MSYKKALQPSIYSPPCKRPKLSLKKKQNQKNTQIFPLSIFSHPPLENSFWKRSLKSSLGHIFLSSHVNPPIWLHMIEQGVDNLTQLDQSDFLFKEFGFRMQQLSWFCNITGLRWKCGCGSAWLSFCHSCLEPMGC